MHFCTNGDPLEPSGSSFWVSMGSDQGRVWQGHGEWTKKKNVEATSKISASKGNNCQNRRDLKYLIAPLWDYQLSEWRKKKIRIKKLIRRKLRKRTEMATWHFESHFQKQSISECLRRDKASTEAVIQTLAILPDWQKFKDLYMSDGGIAHLTSMFLWGDDPGIESNLILTHASIFVDMSRWRLFQGWRTTTLLVHSYSTGDDTDFGE